MPEGAPQSVQAQALNETTIGVTWKPPKSVLQNGRITGYKISYSEWENCEGDDKFERVFKIVVSGSDVTVCSFLCLYINSNMNTCNDLK